MPRAPRFPRSDHCDGHRFFNPRGHINRSWREVLQWKRSARPAPWPSWVEVTPQPAPPTPTDDSLIVTWINHATFLIQSRHGTLITDPVYGACAGPFGRFGPRRVHAPGIAFESLPPIDAVLLTHDHYDHCDLTTLRRIRRRNPQARLVTPLGNASLGRRSGFAAEQIHEGDWWESLTLPNGLEVTITPARHWSNRVRGTRNHRLWGGFHVTLGPRSLLDIGDTGFDPILFQEVGQRFGPVDVALVPIGAYEPRWFMEPQHCNPAEAVAIHNLVRAKLSLGMHWGTFQLTDEARLEPPAALATARAAAGLPESAFRVIAPGHSVVV